MEVNTLKLLNFRNYRDEQAEFDGGINVITGQNAQGKTNLLEAVYLLTGGKSFRTRFDREMIAFDADGAQITAAMHAGGRAQKIEILLRRGLKKKITRNGTKNSAGELSDNLKAVLFSPEDLNLIKDGASQRRKLMDMAISQLRPGYAKLIYDYNKLYDNKTALLRDYRQDTSMMDVYDTFSDGLCRLSAKIIRYRASFATRLGEEAAKIHREFSGADETMCARYVTVSTVTDTQAPAVEIYNQVKEHYLAHRDAELASGQCLTGAHKDELEISINEKSARSYASQGQTRTAALSLKLAEREIYLRETGEYPVLLLDDVLSELDSRRQQFVLNRIGGGQTLITCCEDEQIVQKTGGRVIFVNDGKIMQT